MKKSNRVRQNASAKAAAQQVPTPKGKPATAPAELPLLPDKITVDTFHAPLGAIFEFREPKFNEVFATIDLTHSEFAAVLETGTEPRLAAGAFITAAVREKVARLNQPAKTPDAQPKISPPGERPVELIDTGKLSQEAEGALSTLREAGNAAIALVLVQAKSIAQQTKDFADFEEYDVPGFCDGIVTLARGAGARFSGAFVEYYTSGIAAINKLVTGLQLACPHALDIPHEASQAQSDWDHRMEMESSANALAHCLRKNGDLLGYKDDAGAWELANFVAEKLEGAKDACWLVNHTVMRCNAMLSLLAQQKEESAKLAA